MARWATVARLDCMQTEDATKLYRFAYTNGARSVDGFIPFDGMEDLEAIYESANLFPLFHNRLLPKSRPEYRQFLEWNGFDPDDPPDPQAGARHEWLFYQLLFRAWYSFSPWCYRKDRAAA